MKQKMVCRLKNKRRRRWSERNENECESDMSCYDEVDERQLRGPRVRYKTLWRTIQERFRRKTMTEHLYYEGRQI